LITEWVLASAAVGIAVDVLTGYHCAARFTFVLGQFNRGGVPYRDGLPEGCNL